MELLFLKARSSRLYLFASQGALLLSGPSTSISILATPLASSTKLTLVHKVPHSHSITKFVFALGGDVVATNETRRGQKSERVVTIWNARTWKVRRTLLFGEALALSSDGRTALLRRDDNAIYVVDTNTGKLKRTLKGWRQNLAFSPDGQLMAGKIRDGTTAIWDASTGRRLILIGKRPYEHHYFSHDNTLLAGANSSSIEIYNVKTGTLISSTEGRGDARAPVIFSPDNKTFASAGTDSSWTGCGGDIINEDGSTYSYGDRGCPVDYAFKLWDVKTGQLVQSVKASQTYGIPYEPVAFIKNGEQIICSDEGQLDIRQVPEGRLESSKLERSVAMIGSIRLQAVPPTGNSLVDFVDHSDNNISNTIYVWNIN
ncbi:MAG TPA: hypothetical protein VF681_01275 [Abditibacteriaceae bacterium]|jgi:WD40 repeat protein